MKIVIYILSILLSAAMLTSCNTQENVDTNELPPAEPVLVAETPQFPTVAMHIIQREYAHLKNDGFEKSRKALTFGEYMEQRLLELYPETAYQGIADDAHKELEYNTLLLEQYEEELVAYKQANGVNSSDYEDEYQEFTTLEAEIEYMAMTEEEIDEFIKLEQWATSGTPISREELDALTGNGNSREKLKPGVLGISLISAGVTVGYSAWRIAQSRRRANDKADEHYPNVSNNLSGVKKDAFTHIYVSMLLRRYITKAGSRIVMNRYEAANPNLHARDTVMDLHNNHVGRDSKYKEFRGRRLKDRYKWGTWSNKVRDYINDPSNAAFMDWETTDPDRAAADAEANKVPDSKYIYYSNKTTQ